MYYLFVGLAIFASFLLVLVVLAQNSKGGGLSNQFGGSGASNLIGVKKTGDILERLTWACAIAIMAFTLATNFTVKTGTGPADALIEKAKEEGTGIDLKKNPSPIVAPPADSAK